MSQVTNEGAQSKTSGGKLVNLSKILLLDDWKISKNTALQQLYPGLTREQIESAKLLVDPARISPLLKALIDENENLKEESDKMATDLVRIIAMTERLIDENFTIQKHLNQREGEYNHFIDSVELNKAEEINDYRAQINSLQQENNLLIKHLEDLRNNQNDELVNNLQKELNNAREYNEQLNYNFELAREREEQLAKALELLQTKYQGAIENVAELEEHQLRMSTQFEKLKNDYIKETSQAEIIQKQEFWESQHILIFRDSLGKVKLLNIENQQLLMEIDNLKKEKKQLTLTIADYEDQLENLSKERARLQIEKEEYRQLSDQLYIRGKDAKNQLEIEQLRNQNQTNKEREALNNQEDIMRENLGLIIQNKELKKQYDKLELLGQQQVEEQRVECSKLLDAMKIRYQTSVLEREEQIRSLDAQLSTAYKANEILQKEMEIQKSELHELKQKMVDYLQLKRIIDAQSMEIRTIKLDQQDKKSLIIQLQDELENARYDYKEKEEKLYSVISEQKLKLNEQSLILEDQKKIGFENESLQKEKTLLQNDNIRLQIEISKLSQQLEDCYDNMNRLKEENYMKNQENQQLKNSLETHQQQQQQQFKSRKDDSKELQEENKQLRAQLNELEKKYYATHQPSSSPQPQLGKTNPYLKSPFKS